MKSSFGVFKGLYRNTGIYWNGTYNADGSWSCRTLPEIRAKIDASIAQQEELDRQKHARQLAEAKQRGLWAERDGDTVTLHTPKGTRQMTIRQYRNEVFDIEGEYQADVVFA